MNLKKNYEKLYEHWLQEFENPKLTLLHDNDLKLYKELLDNFNNDENPSENTIQLALLNAYKKNVKYLFNDLLKIRELKIINTALSLIEVNLEQLTESEKLLYQNLVATIKGYKKVKALTIDDIRTGALKEPQDQVAIPSSESMMSVYDEKKSLKEDLVEEFKEEESLKDLVQESEIEYTLIRFIKDTPSLVGIDLINYGPFKEDDIANMPVQNASILINEKYAETIEIS